MDVIIKIIRLTLLPKMTSNQFFLMLLLSWKILIRSHKTQFGNTFSKYKRRQTEIFDGQFCFYTHMIYHSNINFFSLWAKPHFINHNLKFSRFKAIENLKVEWFSLLPNARTLSHKMQIMLFIVNLPIIIVHIYS